MSLDHPSLAPADVEPWVAAAGRDYREHSKNRSWAAATRSALASLRSASDYQELLRRTDEHLEELARARAALQRVRARVEKAADWHDTARCFCDIWLERRRRDVLRAAERSPGQARRAWLDAYAQALAQDGYDAARRLTLQPWARTAVGEDPALLACFRTGAVALKDDRPGDAVAMLTELAEDRRGPTQAGSRARAVAMVLLARIHLYRLSDIRTARSWCTRGLELTPDDGRLQAVRGECLRADGFLDEAEQAFLAAIEADRSLVDGYVGMGLISQDRRRWHQSRDWYDDALDAAGDDPALGLLLAPAPGNLYWQLARRLRTRDPARALEAVDRALSLGVAWWKDHPKRKVFADRGDILVLLERPGDAADSYYEAGRRYCWIGEARAGLPLLRRACEDPSHAPARWQLADALRLLSYRADFPYVDQGLAEEAAAVWEEGLAIRRPDGSTAWAFLTRALLNEQIEKLTTRPGTSYWETVRLLEQAVLLNPSYATAWAYLGQHHRLLHNLAAARHATDRALSIDPADLSALEQHAAVLLAQADYAQAERFALRRLERAREPFPELVAATSMLVSGRYRQALEILDDALTVVPEDVELRSWRALARGIAGRPDEAREDNELVWGHRAGSLPRELSPLVARAALLLGHSDDAAEHYTALLDGDFHGSVPLAGELGLALLLRGSPDDLVRAAHLLRSAIAATQEPHPVRVLGDLLVPAVRALAGPDVSEQGGALFDDVSRLARARSEVLVQQRRTAVAELTGVLAGEVPDEPADDRRLAATAGLARMALDEHRPDEAADRYAVLVRSGALPEAERGLMRAVQRLLDELDARGQQGLPSLGADALRLARLVEESAPGEHQVRAELRARAGMSAVLCGDTAQDRAHLSAVTQLLPRADAVAVTAAAGQQLLSTPAQYWLAVDRLRGLAGEPDLSSAERDHLLATAHRLDLSRLLPVAVAHVDPTAVFPIAPPLGLRLSERLYGGRGQSRRQLEDELARLRDRVHSDTGVRMPKVLVEEDRELAPSAYAIDVRGPVAHGVVPDAGSALDTAVHALETHVRRRLPVLLRLGDVAAMGMAARPLSEWDSASLLRLYRALQSLVADGVRLTADVVATVADQVQVHDAPEAAARTRVSHHGQLPGNAPGVARTSLPPALATRLGAGLQAGAPPRWQLPRAEATAVVADIRTWAGAQAGGGLQALVVPSGDLRPFAARLLAAALPGIPVLSEEEQHARDVVEVDGPRKAVDATARAQPTAAGAPRARPGSVGPARQ